MREKISQKNRILHELSFNINVNEMIAFWEFYLGSLFKSSEKSSIKVNMVSWYIRLLIVSHMEGLMVY